MFNIYREIRNIPEKLKQFVAPPHLVVERHGAMNEIVQDSGVDVDEIGDVRVGRFRVQIPTRDFHVEGGKEFFLVGRQLVFLLGNDRRRFLQQRIVFKLEPHLLQTVEESFNDVVDIGDLVFAIAIFLDQNRVL